MIKGMRKKRNEEKCEKKSEDDKDWREVDR